MSLKTRAALLAQNIATITTNGVGAITGAIHRTINADIIDSCVNKTTDANQCRQQECKSNVAITTVGTAITFDNVIGTGGKSYSLQVNCYDASGNVDYIVTLRTATGFTITPAINCSIDYTATKV